MVRILASEFLSPSIEIQETRTVLNLFVTFEKLNILFYINGKR